MTDHKELRRLAAAATPGLEDMSHMENGCEAECPLCDGDGTVEVLEYHLPDPYVTSVQFFGVGDHHINLQAFAKAASPQAVTALLDKLEDSKRRHEATERQAGYMAETLGGRLEKAVAERDQHKTALEKIRDEYLSEDSDGIDVIFEIACEALATPHTAAPTLQANTPHATAVPAPACPSTLRTSGEQPPLSPVGPADSVQVRTPGTVEVCESCRNTRGLVCDERCARPECPIRPKQGV